jgi:hypothetical protein
MYINLYDKVRKAPVTGEKTITTTAAELFAGTSRLKKRHTMIVYAKTGDVRFGGSSVVLASGGLIPSGEFRSFPFDPSIATPLYFVAAASTTVVVEEYSI